MKEDTPFVITISRQLGSGGAYVGQKLANALNMYYADRDIISRAAKTLSCLEENLKDRDEKVSTFWDKYFTANALGASGEYIMPQTYVPTDYELFEAETEVIRHIAAERPCVIIGRCAAHILKGRENLINIFLHADCDFRKKRMMEVMRISDASADKMITQSDRERSKHHMAFTKVNWMDLSLYDICLDTSRLGLDFCADLLLQIVKEKTGK